MSDAETLKVYGRQAQEYADIVADTAPRDPLLAAFLAELAPGSRLLDLGCGPGQYAALMAAAGHQVTATDAAPEMVALAAEHPGVTAEVATFDDIAGEGIYDGIWANFSLLHAPRAEMPGYLKALHRALTPGGLFHIALKSGDAEKRDRLGRLYSYYSDAALTGLLEAAGFTVTDRAEGEDRGLDGALAHWIALRARA